MISTYLVKYLDKKKKEVCEEKQKNPSPVLPI